MKKSLLLLLFLAVAAFASAQDVAESDFAQFASAQEMSASDLAPSVMTSGTILTEHDMAGFQQSKEALEGGRSRDQKMAIAGWVLFAAGIPVTAYGGYLIDGGIKGINNEEKDIKDAFGQGFGGTFLLVFGSTITFVGAAAVTTGIVLLSISYSNMGGHAHLTDTGIRQRKPLVTYNLQSSRDGLGFAIRF